MSLTVSEIAEKIGGTVDGDGSGSICGVAGVRDAVEGEITFIANPKYASALEITKASAVIVSNDLEKKGDAALIRVENPDKAFAEVAMHFAPPDLVFDPGVHPTAVVADGVTLGVGVHVGAHCVIEAGAKIGARTVIMAQCYIGHESVIGDDCKLYPGVSFRERVRIGDRVIIHNSSVVGSDGFGFAADQEGVRSKIPQIGTVIVGDDVEIGAGVTIDRARFGATRIGNGVKIDNLVQIAHNVVIGDHSVLVAQVGIAGSTTVGKKVIFAGQSGAVGHVHVGDGTVVAAKSGVTKDTPPGSFVSGFPAEPHKDVAKARANLHRLPQLKKKVKELEDRLKKLEG